MIFWIVEPSNDVRRAVLDSASSLLHQLDAIVICNERGQFSNINRWHRPTISRHSTWQVCFYAEKYIIFLKKKTIFDLLVI